MDPRTSLIKRRLAGIQRVIAVSSGKGGVGKSVVAAVLALSLSRKGLKVGLLDLDFTGPSSHLILGVDGPYPEERKGIVPPMVHGLEYMSIVFYSGDRPSPLRGAEISNALIELLTITRWGGLDFLLVDMPPGLTDASLDILSLVKSVEFLLVTSPSLLVFTTVRKLIELLLELKVPIVGVIENLEVDESPFIRGEVEGRGLNYWGALPLDRELDGALGDIDRLLATAFGRRLEAIVQGNLDLGGSSRD